MSLDNSLLQYLNTVDNKETLSSIVNRANEEFNEASWKFYCEKLAPQPTDEWRRIVFDSEVDVKASILSLDSPLPPKAISGAEEISGNMARMGHSFIMNAVDLRMLQRMAYVGDDMVNAYLAKFYEKTKAQIGGIHARLNEMAFQAISTGKIVFDNTSSPDGTFFEVDLKVPAKHKIKCKDANGKDWSDDDYDPINDLNRMVEIARESKISVSHFEMTRKTYNRLVSHPLVLSKYRTMMSWDVTANLSHIDPNIVWNKIREFTGLLPILIIDEMSMIEVDGRPVDAGASFAEDNVVLRGLGHFFDLVNTIPLNAGDPNPGVITTFTEGQLITVQRSFASDPRAEKIGFETEAISIAKDPKNIVILNTGESSVAGTGI